MAAMSKVDEQLLNEAYRLGNEKTKCETINEALQEYIDRRKPREIIKVFGKIDFDRDYDYKVERGRGANEGSR